MIQFTHPAYLIILPPLIYLAWRLSKASLADLPRARKMLSLGIRIVVLCLIVLSISGIQMVKSSKSLAVIFALDISDSISPDKRDQAMSYIRQAVKEKREGDYVGLVVFGSDASVELAPEKTAGIDRIRSIPSTSYTDIAQGLGLAVASFPADASKRIVLITDGNENLGNALDQAAMADTEGIAIDVVPISNDQKQEVLLDKLMTPSEVKIGEPFELRVIARAKTSAQAEVRLLRNGEPAGTKKVSLSPGRNVLAFPQSIEKSGVYSYKAFIESSADTMLDNNQAIGSTKVQGKPKVLYIEGVAGQAENLAKALRASDIEVEVRGESGVPATMDELRNYDSIVLSDIPATAMSPEQMKLVEAGVRDLGIGFGMIGGENSFGAGGYFNTPIERALPVDMSIRKQKVLPSLSVVIVIDKSGSMGAMEDGRTKMSLANEAAVNVVMLLQNIDKIGVIFCHNYPKAVVPLTSATNKDGIAAQISTVNAEGGGITVFPSLQAAYQMIAGSGTRQKHVIMLCDGADCDEQEGCVPLAARMKKEGITVTSVAIGDGRDVPFLQQMAAAGGGNFYLARLARELPYIFTKDVMMVSKSLIVEEPFLPRADASTQVLSGIDWKSVPPLLGYVSTSPKSIAEVPIVSHKEDPIYAQWHYGLGRSIAFTSDAKPRWAVRWLDWPGFTKFWAQAVRWSMKKSTNAQFQTTVEIDRAIGRVVVDAVDPEGRFINFLVLEGRLIRPDRSSTGLKLEQTAPGRYEAEFPARQVGEYTVNVFDKSNKESAQSCSVTIPYPPEYKDIQTNRRLLERICSTTGGQLSPPANKVFRSDSRKARVPTDLWWTLTLVALILFPLDVAVRRLAMDASEVRELILNGIGALRARLPQTSHAPKKTKVETVGKLLESKKSRQQTEDRPEWIKPQPATKSVEPQMPTVRESQKTEDIKPADEPIKEKSDTTSRLLDAKRRARQKHEKGE